MDQENGITRIALPAREGYTFCTVEEIIYCQADKNYTTIYLHHRPAVVISKHLAAMDRLLSGSCFVRIHQSYLVNLSFVSMLLTDDGACVLLTTGETLPVAAVRKAAILQCYKLP